MPVVTVDAKSLAQLCMSVGRTTAGPSGMVVAVFAMLSALRRNPVLRQWAISVAKQYWVKDLAVGAVVSVVMLPARLGGGHYWPALGLCAPKEPNEAIVGRSKKAPTFRIPFVVWAT